MDITIQITDEDYKVLAWQVPDPEQWIIDAVKGKISNSKKRMLLELTDKRIEKVTDEESNSLIRDSRLKTRKQRDEAARTIT